MLFIIQFIQSLVSNIWEIWAYPDRRFVFNLQFIVNEGDGTNTDEQIQIFTK